MFADVKLNDRQLSKRGFLLRPRRVDRNVGNSYIELFDDLLTDDEVELEALESCKLRMPFVKR